VGETLLAGRGQALRAEDLAAAPFPRPAATGFAGLFKRPAGADLYGQVPVIQGLSLPFTYPPIGSSYVLFAALVLLLSACGQLTSPTSADCAVLQLEVAPRRRQ